MSESNYDRRICVKCEIVKPFTEFYKRRGFTGDLPGHYTSECKDCMRARSRESRRLPAYEPAVETERLAIERLVAEGIPTAPGKAVALADCDLVAWGCVMIEVKYARLALRRGAYRYHFEVTPVQRSRGFKAHVVMLICDDDGDLTYHLFKASHEVFYIERAGKRRLKSGFTYTPDSAPRQYDDRLVMSDSLMMSAEDNYELIERVRLAISNKLKSKVR